jgi:hypothetical protein
MASRLMKYFSVLTLVTGGIVFEALQDQGDHQALVLIKLSRWLSRAKKSSKLKAQNLDLTMLA